LSEKEIEMYKKFSLDDPELWFLRHKPVSVLFSTQKDLEAKKLKASFERKYPNLWFLYYVRDKWEFDGKYKESEADRLKDEWEEKYKGK
jgi:hypothetical protein